MEEKEIIDLEETMPEEITSEELKTSIETKIRTALFFIAWVNQVFAFFGAPTLDLDFGSVYAVVSAIAAFAISIWAWWKNNSFTVHALIGDAFKDAAKKALHAK